MVAFLPISLPPSAGPSSSPLDTHSQPEVLCGVFGSLPHLQPTTSAARDWGPLGSTLPLFKMRFCFIALAGLELTASTSAELQVCAITLNSETPCVT